MPFVRSLATPPPAPNHRPHLKGNLLVTGSFQNITDFRIHASPSPIRKDYFFLFRGGKIEKVPKKSQRRAVREYKFLTAKTGTRGSILKLMKEN